MEPTTSLLPGVRQQLEAEVERLRGRPDVPVRVEEIAKSLGLRIRRSRDAPEGKAVLVGEPAATNILLGSLTDGEVDGPLGARDRFLVSHEIGHWMLLDHGVPRPATPGEYWQQEDLCDAFARALLLPRPEIVRIVALARTTARQRLNVCTHIAKLCAAPWQATAQRLTDLDGAAAFLEIQERPDGRFRIRASTLPSRRERGRLFDSAHPLGESLRQIPKTAGPEEISSKGLDQLPGFRGFSVSAAAAMRRTRSVFCVVVLLSPPVGAFDEAHDRATEIAGS